MSFSFLTPLLMTSAQRLLSLSLMGGLTIAVAPLAGAQGPFADLDDEDRTAIRAQLEACRDENEEREDKKACADAVFEDHDIERPERHGRRGRGQKVGHKFRSNINDTCGERENTEQWRACAKESRGEVRPHFRRQRGGIRASTDLRAELRACLEIDDNEELRECVFGVREAVREQLDN